METVPCNLCGANDTGPVIVGRDQLFDHGDTFTLVQCKRCKLVYLNPRPDVDELHQFYPTEYQCGMSDYADEITGVAKQGYDMILRRRTPPGATGRVLDIGCSAGAYLSSLRDLGWEVYGIEIDPEVAGRAIERFGDNIRTGPAEVVLADYPDDFFDVVTLWHTLEHLLDPLRVLSEARRVLKPDGRLMLEVPNFASVSRRVLGNYWCSLDIPRHLYHFTPRTMEKLLSEAGFRVDCINGVPSAIAMTSSVQLMWNKWTGRRARNLILNPVLLCLFFPLSWLLARVRLSSAMTADAIKPVALEQPQRVASAAEQGAALGLEESYR